MWVVSRSYGSLIGPEASTRAQLGFGDIVTTLVEAAIVAGSLIWVGTSNRRRMSSQQNELINVLVVLATALLTTVALYSAVGGKPFVTHVG